MRHIELTLAEKEKLIGYRVSFQESVAIGGLSVSVRDLLNYDQLDHFINLVQQKLNAPSKLVAVSMFSKRYSYVIAVPALYTLAILNKQLRYTTNDLTLVSAEANGHWLPKLNLSTDIVMEPETLAERSHCREQLITQLFSEHLNVVWGHLSDIGKISKQTLWENTAVYIFWIYESLLKEDLSEDIKNRVIDDFNFILKSSGHLFGDYNRNPLSRFYHEKTKKNGNEVRVRKTCCFAYEMSGNMCNGCPKDC